MTETDEWRGIDVTGVEDGPTSEMVGCGAWCGAPECEARCVNAGPALPHGRVGGGGFR